MDRQDLTWAQVALEARIRSLAPALETLKVEHGERLRDTASAFRRLANGYSPINHAADQLDAIAEHGHNALLRPAHEELGLAVEVIARMIREKPMNRQARRYDAAREERDQRRLARSERLRDLRAQAERERLNGK